MSAVEGKTGKVFAWIIPEEKGLAWVPVGEKQVVFGHKVKENVHYLKRIYASAEQAVLTWSDGSLFLKNPAGSEFTVLNGLPAGTEKQELFHEDKIMLAGERFRVFRLDRRMRPIPTCVVTFLCENEIISRCECKKGEMVALPYMPKVRMENGGIKLLAGWIDSENKPFDGKHSIFCKDTSFSAIYKNPDPNTTRIEKRPCIMDNATYMVAEIPPSGFRFGGGKQFECCLSDMTGKCAEITAGATELIAYRNACVRLNGSTLSAGERCPLQKGKAVSVSVCGHEYTILMNESEKEPLLRLENGTEEILQGLTEGKSVYVGRSYQKMLGNIYFITHAHACIRKQCGKFFISDNHSKNGTTVTKAQTGKVIQLGGADGQTPETELESGDIIGLSFVNVTFVAK